MGSTTVTQAASGSTAETQAIVAARRHLVAFLNRVPHAAGIDGVRLDDDALLPLPRFGLELEFVAGHARTCDYNYDSFIGLARRVARLVGIGHGRLGFGFHQFGTPEAPMIKWRDAANRSWEVHADDLFGNEGHRAAKERLSLIHI